MSEKEPSSPKNPEIIPPQSDKETKAPAPIPSGQSTGLSVMAAQTPMVPSLVAEASEMVAKRNALKEFVKQTLTPDVDYGVIPGTDKPTLLKAGAEKILHGYGLFTRMDIEDKVENWGQDGSQPFFRYIVRCSVIWPRRTAEGTTEEIVVASHLGDCNSMESRYAYRWVFDNKMTAAQKEEAKEKGYKRETKTGKFGPYTRVRFPNEEIHTLVNTILKMAEKRAMVGATLAAVNASDLYTQDMEDIAAATGKEVQTSAPKAAGKPVAVAKPNGDSERKVLTTKFTEYVKEFGSEYVATVVQDVTDKQVRNTSSLSLDDLKNVNAKLAEALKNRDQDPMQSPEQHPPTDEQARAIVKLKEEMGDGYAAAYKLVLGDKDENSMSEADAAKLLSSIKKIEKQEVPQDLKEAKYDSKGLEIKGWSNCNGKDCGQEIYWVTGKTPKSKVPMNPDGTRHHTTCPNVADFKKDGGSKAKTSKAKAPAKSKAEAKPKTDAKPADQGGATCGYCNSDMPKPLAAMFTNSGKVPACSRCSAKINKKEIEVKDLPKT